MSVFERPAFKGAAVLACVAALAAAGPGLSQAPRASASGAFSADQAAKGGKIYADNCATCHGADFGGSPGAPSLKGPEFMFGWNAKTVGQLTTYVHDNMPPGQAGSLSDQDYADVVAAILGANGFAAGAAPLAAGAAASSGITVGQP
jgi:mono/diheme cytochrome c family protein